MSATTNSIRTVLLLGILTGLMLFIGNLLGGMGGLTIAIIIVLVMNLGTYWFSDKLVLMMYRAKEAKKNEFPELHEMVDKIAHAAKIPKPKVYVMANGTPNAFATGRNPQHAAIAVTTGIMQLLNPTELKGVIAHEMAHIKNRDTLIQMVASTIAGVISYAAMMARWGAIFGGMGGDRGRGSGMIELLVLAILAPLIAIILQLAISRSREYLADETGAKTIHNPKALADALAKLEGANKVHPMAIGNKATSSMFIVNPFSAGALAGLFSTHPPIKERVKRLRHMKSH